MRWFRGVLTCYLNEMRSLTGNCVSALPLPGERSSSHSVKAYSVHNYIGSVRQSAPHDSLAFLTPPSGRFILRRPDPTPFPRPFRALCPQTDIFRAGGSTMRYERVCESRFAGSGQANEDKQDLRLRQIS
jgi:hypothetical protein